MYSSSVLLICATAFILVQCRDHHSPPMRFHEPVMEPIEICQPNSKEYKRDLRAVMRNSTCKPYLRHVALQPEPGYMFSPSMVAVPRCDGRCSNGLMCEPQKVGMKKVPVTAMNTYKRMTFAPGKCTFVEVEEHLRCGCMCNQKERDCIPKRQQYMSNQCKCVCTDLSAKENCKGEFGMMWDEKTCECKCLMKIMDCTTGQEWNPTTCKCEPIRKSV